MPLVRMALPIVCLDDSLSDFIEVFVAGVGIDFDPNSDVFGRLNVNMPYIMQVGTSITCDLELD